MILVFLVILGILKTNTRDGQLCTFGKLYLIIYTNQVTNMGYFKCLVKIGFVLLVSTITNREIAIKGLPFKI